VAIEGPRIELIGRAIKKPLPLFSVGIGSQRDFPAAPARGRGSALSQRHYTAIRQV